MLRRSEDAMLATSPNSPGVYIGSFYAVNVGFQTKGLECLCFCRLSLPRLLASGLASYVSARDLCSSC